MQQINSGSSHGVIGRPQDHISVIMFRKGQIKLACGYMLPVVAGTSSPNGQNMLKDSQLQMTPYCKGQVNGIATMVLRDTGSTTFVVKSSLVSPEQMTGSHELCMLIDGFVKRYPTAVVELTTPYYTGTAKVSEIRNHLFWCCSQWLDWYNVSK